MHASIPCSYLLCSLQCCSLRACSCGPSGLLPYALLACSHLPVPISFCLMSPLHTVDVACHFHLLSVLSAKAQSPTHPARQPKAWPRVCCGSRPSFSRNLAARDARSRSPADQSSPVAGPAVETHAARARIDIRAGGAVARGSDQCATLAPISCDHNRRRSTAAVAAMGGQMLLQCGERSSAGAHSCRTSADNRLRCGGQCSRDRSQSRWRSRADHNGNRRDCGCGRHRRPERSATAAEACSAAAAQVARAKQCRRTGLSVCRSRGRLRCRRLCRRSAAGRRRRGAPAHRDGRGWTASTGAQRRRPPEAHTAKTACITGARPRAGASSTRGPVTSQPSRQCRSRCGRVGRHIAPRKQQTCALRSGLGATPPFLSCRSVS